MVLLLQPTVGKRGYFWGYIFLIYLFLTDGALNSFNTPEVATKTAVYEQREGPDVCTGGR